MHKWLGTEDQLERLASSSYMQCVNEFVYRTENSSCLIVFQLLFLGALQRLSHSVGGIANPSAAWVGCVPALWLIQQSYDSSTQCFHSHLQVTVS